MIKNITVANFQSHKLTSLELHPGVNAIVGSSNSGKTAVLRALYWLRFNRPSGVDFVSHWNQDKNGNPVKSTTVAIQLTDSLGIQRRRAKDFNGYTVHDPRTEAPGKELEAVKTDVPEEIESALNMSDVNIQRQMDAPFLLSASSGEVARFFNRIIRLDLIDRVLSTAESRRRKTKQDIERLTESETGLAAEYDKMSWVEIAACLVDKSETLQRRMTTNRDRHGKISSLVSRIQGHRQECQELGWVATAESLLSRMAPIQARIQTTTDRRRRIQSLQTELTRLKSAAAGLGWVTDAEYFVAKITPLRQHRDQLSLRQRGLIEIQTGLNQYRTQLGALPDLSAAGSIIGQITEVQSRIVGNRRRQTAVNALYQDIKEHRQTIIAADRESQSLTAQLPAVCPLCGGPWRDEHEQH